MRGIPVLAMMGAAIPALYLAACSSPDGSPTTPHLGASCVDDSQHCIKERGQALNSFLADGSRSWVKQPPTAANYASGVRLFAFSKQRKSLSCEELQTGRREADNAPGTLRGASGTGLTPAQISRSIMLASEVSRDLGREFDRRCKKA